MNSTHLSKLFSNLHFAFLLFLFLPYLSYAQDNWIGITPSELVPGAKPLGKMKGRNFDNSQPAISVKQEIIELKEPVDPTPTEKKPREFSDFHSNLGQQPIVEKIPTRNNNWIGAKPSQIIPYSKPLGSMKNRFYEDLDSANAKFQESGMGKQPATESPPLPFDFSVFGSVRPYYTNNVLRTKEDELDSGVLENTIGASLASKPLQAGQYITLVPHLDFLMQWANYGEKSIKDLLNYRFGMVKGNLDIYLPHDFRISPGVEYDFLHSQFTGNKLFDAVAPSLSVQKIFGLSESTFFMLDGLFKYSSTNRVISFETNDIFPDDGDNIQFSLNLNLMQSFGPGGQFMIMPGLGITRTEYLKNNQNGRVDMIYFAGLSGIWQPLQWLSFQTFGNFSAMNTNAIGEELLKKSSKFQAWDIGASITASHTF